MSPVQRTAYEEQIAALEEADPSDFSESGDYEEGLTIVESMIYEIQVQLGTA